MGAHAERNGVVTQLSTIQALASGLYHGFETVGDMLRHGDFGLGTFEGLNGELAAVDGRVYRFSADGHLEACEDQTKVSFYVVTRGLDAGGHPLAAGTTFADFKRLADTLPRTLQVCQAVRVDGFFRYVRTRSLPHEVEPYPPLIDVSREQPEFEFRDLQATLVGFRYPDCLRSVNMAGHHLHLLGAERDAGGHILDFEIEQARFSIEMRNEFRLRLPSEHPAFQDLESLERPEHEIAEIEG